MITQLLAIDLTGADLIILIPLIASAIVSIVVALRTGQKVSSVDEKLVTRNGQSVASQVDDLTTMAVIATPPEQRTPAQIAHLDAARSAPATDASLTGNGVPVETPPPEGTQ